MQNRKLIRRFRIILYLLGIGGFIIYQYFVYNGSDFVPDNLYVSGQVLKISKSRNHSFGIVQFRIDSISHVKYLDETYSPEMPFRISKTVGEVYGTIGVTDTQAKQVILKAGVRKFYMLEGGKLISEGILAWINSKRDLEFIRKNSILFDQENGGIQD